MVELKELDFVLKQAKIGSDFFLNTVIKRNQEEKLLIFYSMGFLADQYISMSEDSLKKGEEYQATNFANKAEEIRQATKDIFGDVPEREYYKAIPFKIPRWYSGSMHPEQVVQLAQFCVSNVQPEEDVMSDEKLLYATIRGKLKEHRRAFHDASGLEYQCISVLRERFKMLADKPPKLMGIYEMLLLLDVVDQVLDMVKNPKPEDQGEIAEEEPDEGGEEPESE